MAQLLEFEYMRRALAAGVLIAIAAALVGVTMTLKRMAMVGDALSHASLAGVACGLAVGFDPILGAGVACVAAALGVEAVRRRLPRRAELSVAIIMSAAVGIAGALSGFSRSPASFGSYLFGSVVAITASEMTAVAVVTVGASLACALLRKELFLLALDERAARLAGVSVGAANLAFTVIAAAAVSVAARTAGALVVSSLMATPVACALQYARSYRQAVTLSLAFSVSSAAIGIVAAFYFALRPGSAIVLTGVVFFLISAAIRRIRRK